MTLLRILNGAHVFKKYNSSYINVIQKVCSSPSNFIAGSRKEGTSKDCFVVKEPATNTVLSELRNSSQNDIDEAISGALTAFNSWSKLTGFDRGQVMSKAASIIRQRVTEISHIETADTGKAFWEAECDVLGCADMLDFYAGLAPTVQGAHRQLSNGSFGYTIKEALGVCVGIGAWNYPFQMAIFKSAPALACGNTMIFKPSELTPFSATLIAEVYKEAGIPDGVFQVIQGTGHPTGSYLTSHPEVAKVSFTGSVETGAKIYASSANQIKPITLELGGKSGLIIFEDSSIPSAVTGAMFANFLSQGQVCSNASRVFVHKAILTEFLQELVSRTKAMPIGDPHDLKTRVGATVSESHAAKVLSYISRAKSEGAHVLFGGERLSPKELPSRCADGFFLRPCILTPDPVTGEGLSDTCTIMREEVFGAVMCVVPFDTEDEVISRVNATSLGLAGGVFTRDLSRAHRVVSRINAGTIYVNTYNAFPLEIPFGGFKRSGLGKECGIEALDYWTRTKGVIVEMNDCSKDAPF